MISLSTLALALAVITGGRGPVPAEDDARTRITFALAELAAGGAESYRVYEWHRSPETGRLLYVGISLPASECSIGSYYHGRSHTWTPLAVECD